MKQFVYKVNTYLLERYPTLWNTRILWMLLASLGVHFAFFILGFLALTNPLSLQEYGAKDVFFSSGALYLSIIITLLLLTIWLLFLFKNNAFKSFYPTSWQDPFKQFLAYFIIVMAASTFYFSYQAGLKLNITNSYPNKIFKQHVDTANTAAVFFSTNLHNYTLSQKRYPKIFDNSYCETIFTQMYLEKPHFQFKELRYQFFNVIEKSLSHEDNIYGKRIEGFVYSKNEEDSIRFYYKDSVIDLSNYVTSAHPSYYNYSNTFFESAIFDEESSNYNSVHAPNDFYGENYGFNYNYSEKKYERNKKTFHYLKNSSQNEITSLITKFLEILDLYKVDYNINAEAWINIIYASDNFEVRKFIRTEPKTKTRLNFAHTEMTENGEITESEKFHTEHLTDYYIEHPKLLKAFENIISIKNSPLIGEGLHIFLWLAFFISSIIFAFRITGLRSLLFTILTVGILILLITLLAAALSQLDTNTNNFTAYLAIYLSLVIYGIGLSISLFFAEKIKKTIVAISLNITIIFFPLMLLLIVGIISMYQQDACNDLHQVFNTSGCPTLIKLFELNWSWIFLFSSLLFLWILGPCIKKWKALPEA